MVVGIMAINPREKVATLIDSAKFSIDIPSKLGHLRRLRGELSHADVALLSHSLPSLLNLHTDRFSPVRKFITELIGNIGLKWMQLLPEIVPVLLTVLKDGTPAVARQAITCGTDLFRSTVVKIAIQGMHSTELDDFLESSWAWVLKLRDEIYSIAFQSGSDGKRLLALKFVEAVILLYTPDPSGSLEPPDDQTIEEKSKQFNISWLRGGHPVLKIGDLSIEASQSLGLLLDQLRFPAVKSLSNLTVIVLINSLSSIAKKRPSFYGRILPVLLGLDPSSSFGQELYISGVYHALKNAFISCLKCSHPSAAPWRDRLDGALREINAGGSAKQTLNQVSQIDGNVEWKSDSSFIKEEKQTIEIFDAVQNIAGRKRAGVQEESSNLFEDDAASGKRARQTPNDSDGSTQEASRDQPAVASSGSKIYRGNGDNGPVQQLVAMFGALVAQGEKAIGSLEILVSSISADLLAEVVMANMQHLPPSYPNADGNQEPLLNLGSHPKIVDHETQIKQLSSFLTDLLSLSSGISTTYSVLDSKQSASNELEKLEEDKNHVATTANSDAACSVLNYACDQAPTHTSLSVLEDVPSVRETGSSSIPLESADIGNLVGEIPGLDSFVPSDALPETLLVSSLPSTDVEESSQEQITSLGKMPMDLLPSVSADRSEELSPKEAATDVTSVHSSTSTSVGQSTQVILPKMSAPVIDLEDKQKDKLQIFAYMRIIEAYRQVAVAGGSQVRFSLLAYLGVEYPLELDPWKLLHTHIMSDYTIHEGHELTLRVLFRLFGEAERESDFFSSTSATSVYEIFLLTVAETLKDSFPASDKSLSRLLNEVPYLPKSIYNLLESLCSPGSSDKEDKEFHTGDRVTQGLSAVWSLILLRPPIRDACLNIALQSAVHHLEEVRMKAIRLVANKLYPLSSISQQIEEFAKEMLLSVAKLDPVDRKDADGSNPGLLKDRNMEKPSDEHSSVCALTKEVSSNAAQSCTSERISSSLIEVQRCTSLYFALCTKKHSLLRQIFVMYTSISDTVKQVVRRQIPILIRTIGSSSELLDIVSDPPTGSEDLLMQVLHTLTDGTVPSQELVTSIKKLYDTKLKDIQILIPILPSLPREEILLIFRHIIHLPLDKFQAALARLLQGSSHSGPILTPAEILIAIHGIDPDRDGIPLKKVTDACNACFEQREIFTQQVLAKVLNHLVEQIPLPLLFMRTVLQALGAFPSLMEFIMEILSRLVSKQIWKYPKLWVGFLKCAILTKPQSFSVLLQLPPAQLEAALNRTPALKAPLSEHANQPNIRLSLPRSVLVVLGVVSDSQVSVQAQASVSQDGDAGNLDKQAVTEKSKESPSIN